MRCSSLDQPMWPEAVVWVRVRSPPLATVGAEAGPYLQKDCSHGKYTNVKGSSQKSTVMKTIIICPIQPPNPEYLHFLILLINPFNKIRRIKINGMKGITQLIILEITFQFTFPKLPEINQPAVLSTFNVTLLLLPAEVKHVGAASVLDLRKSHKVRVWTKIEFACGYLGTSSQGLLILPSLPRAAT